MYNVQILYGVITHVVWLSQIVMKKEFNSNADAEVTKSNVNLNS